MTSTDPGTGPVGPRPDPVQPSPAPQGAWAPPQQPGAWVQPQQPGPWVPPQDGASAVPGSTPGRATRWLRVGTPIAVDGVVGLGSLGGWLGWGDPEVDDCVQMVGATSFDVVDCGSAEAEYRIVGIEDEEMDYPAFMADPDVCTGFESTDVALWIGELETEPGTVFCAEPTGAGGL